MDWERELWADRAAFAEQLQGRLRKAPHSLRPQAAPTIIYDGHLILPTNRCRPTSTTSVVHGTDSIFPANYTNPPPSLRPQSQCIH